MGGGGGRGSGGGGGAQAVVTAAGSNPTFITGTRGVETSAKVMTILLLF